MAGRVRSAEPTHEWGKEGGGIPGGVLPMAGCAPDPLAPMTLGVAQGRYQHGLSQMPTACGPQNAQLPRRSPNAHPATPGVIRQGRQDGGGVVLLGLHLAPIYR